MKFLTVKNDLPLPWPNESVHPSYVSFLLSDYPSVKIKKRMIPMNTEINNVKTYQLKN